MKMKQLLLLLLPLIIVKSALAEPSPHIVSKVRNSISFNIDTNIQLLKVSDLKTGKVIHAAALKSDGVKFIENTMLSEDYIVIREWTGGASCCFIVHAFQTKPTFKKLLEHNNEYFDSSELIVGKTKLGLHKEPFISIGGGAHPKYNPAIFDLKTGDWE
jgi:hypothetical protein